MLSTGIVGLKANENVTHGNDDKINYQSLKYKSRKMFSRKTNTLTHKNPKETSLIVSEIFVGLYTSRLANKFKR